MFTFVHCSMNALMCVTFPQNTLTHSKGSEEDKN